MISIDKARQIIEDELSKWMITREPITLYEPIAYIVSLGGKHLRPSLAVMAASIYTDTYLEVLPAALALEVFHNFTLLHDDLMDNALLRRNKPTVHTRWNSSTAILSGDAMLILAFQLIQKSKSAVLPQLMDIFTKTALEVCEGQQFDMDFESRNDISETEYLKMIELKTAVLLAACLKIGAIAGGASAQQSDILYEAGRNIGMAFQLQDDLLDTYGDSNIFGKKIGGDIIENKKTYLYIRTREVAAPSDSAELFRIYATTAINPEVKVNAVKKIFDKSDIRGLTSVKIGSYLNEAMKCFESLDAPSETKNNLKSLLDYLLKRDN